MRSRRIFIVDKSAKPSKRQSSRAQRKRSAETAVSEKFFCRRRAMHEQIEFAAFKRGERQRFIFADNVFQAAADKAQKSESRSRGVERDKFRFLGKRRFFRGGGELSDLFRRADNAECPRSRSGVPAKSFVCEQKQHPFFLFRKKLRLGQQQTDACFHVLKSNCGRTQKQKNRKFETCGFLVGRWRLELQTNCLKGNCSTIELASHRASFVSEVISILPIFFQQCKQIFLKIFKTRFYPSVTAMSAASVPAKITNAAVPARIRVFRERTGVTKRP